MAALADAPESVGEPPDGFSLTELLVAAALSLVVMGTVAALFGVLSRSIRQSQATVDLGGLMRSAAWQLRQDLTGLTCAVGPWVAPETSSGYFELLEGPAHDSSAAIDQNGRPTAILTADTDDILLFTTQSLAEPLVGRYAGTLIESPYAEVAWFCRPAASQPVPGTTLYDLHRRQLLVATYLGRADLADNALSGTVNRAAYDLSLRSGTLAGREGIVLLPNSLGDLTKREHRFLRSGISFTTTGGLIQSVPAQAFPFPFPLVSPSASGSFHAPPEASFAETPRAGEDVILTNVVAFDVRVYDPQAIVPLASGTIWRLPGDSGYDAALTSETAGLGAYVDLGRLGTTPLPRTVSFPPTGTSALQSAGVCVSGTQTLTVTGTGTGAVTVPTYDTWSRHYEFNGIDDDRDGAVDQGSNGADTDADGWPDAGGDAETSPPYPVPLRGLEVRIRCYEPTSKQVRQITIRQALRQ